MSLTYQQVADWLRDSLVTRNWQPMPIFDPGPASDQMLQRRAPQSIVFPVLGNGAGLNTEGLFDSIFLSIHVFGPQGNFAKAEELALVFDQIVLDANRWNSTIPITHATRTGGRPAVVEKDASDRYHLSCTYVLDAQT